MIWAVTLPAAEHGNVDSHADGAVRRCLGALDQRPRDASVPQDCELQPAATTLDRRYVLDRGRCLHAHDLDQARVTRRPGDSYLAIGMSHAIEAARRGQDRRVRSFPEQSRGEVDRPHVHERPRTKPEPVPGGKVLAQRQLVVRTAREIVEDHLWQPLLRRGLVVVQVQDRRHDCP